MQATFSAWNSCPRSSLLTRLANQLKFFKKCTKGVELYSLLFKVHLSNFRMQEEVAHFLPF